MKQKYGDEVLIETNPEFIERLIKKEVTKFHQSAEEKKVVVSSKKKINYVGLYHKLHVAKMKKRNQGEVS